MTTIADFRGRITDETGLATSERGGTQASMDRHILQAVAEMSLHLPLKLETDVAVTGGSRRFGLASLIRPIRINAVEYPVGQWPRALLEFVSEPLQDVCDLDHAPPGAGYTVRVYHDAYHLVDATGSTVRAEHEHLVVWGGAGFAYLARAAAAANTADAATSNQPLTYQHLRIGEMYLRLFRDELRRHGSALRARPLYAAAAPPVRADVVTWAG